MTNPLPLQFACGSMNFTTGDVMFFAYLVLGTGASILIAVASLVFLIKMEYSRLRTGNILVWLSYVLPGTIICYLARRNPDFDPGPMIGTILIVYFLALLPMTTTHLLYLIRQRRKATQHEKG